MFSFPRPYGTLLREGVLYAELWRKQSGDFNPVARRPALLEREPEPSEAELTPIALG